VEKALVSKKDSCQLTIILTILLRNLEAKTVSNMHMYVNF
jgi:hypothetical protein